MPVDVAAPGLEHEDHLNSGVAKERPSNAESPQKSNETVRKKYIELRKHM